jgi:periplasmic protein CpxP/Spy
MSTHTKSKLYLLIIGILIITNIAMLFFFLKGQHDGGGKPPHPDRSAMMKDFLQNEIGFNTQQLQQYDSMSKQHKENAKAQFDSLRNNKEQEFKELGSRGFSDSAITELAGRSAEKQKTMELQLLNHFAAIRKLCTTEQQPKFDSLFYKIWNKKKKPDEKSK